METGDDANHVVTGTKYVCSVGIASSLALVLIPGVNSDAQFLLDVHPLLNDPLASADYPQDSLTTNNHLNIPPDIQSREQNAQAFFAHPVRKLPVSQLQRIFEHQDALQAMRLLNRPSYLDVDEHLLQPRFDCDYALSEHNIDFVLAIPRHQGFDVLLPPTGHTRSNEYRFELDLRCPQREFRYKHGLLGFDPTAAALFVGKHQDYDIWLMFPLREEFTKLGGAYPAGKTFAGSTTLSRRHRRIVFSYLLYLLSEFGVGGVNCPPTRRYSASLDREDEKYGFASEFRQVCIIPFSFASC
jgi:hypothetical protein